MDPRVREHARTVVDHSAGIEAGERVPPGAGTSGENHPDVYSGRWYQYN
ncbi:hypothetical protein [Halobellus ruber]|nr:hypothetical protein [Halobellus ruber]